MSGSHSQMSIYNMFVDLASLVMQIHMHEILQRQSFNFTMMSMSHNDVFRSYTSASEE